MHSTDSAALNTLPTWRAIPGYAYGLPQSSMQTQEVFPLGKGVERVAKAFNAVIAQVVGDEDTPPPGPRSHLLVVETIARAVALSGVRLIEDAVAGTPCKVELFNVGG